MVVNEKAVSSMELTGETMKVAMELPGSASAGHFHKGGKHGLSLFVCVVNLGSGSHIVRAM